MVSTPDTYQGLKFDWILKIYQEEGRTINKNVIGVGTTSSSQHWLITGKSDHYRINLNAINDFYPIKWLDS